MPQVRVQLFGPARDAAGLERIDVNLPEGATVAVLAGELGRRFAGLAGGVRFLRFAIKEEFVPLDTELAGGDEVAVIPPVSGG